VLGEDIVGLIYNYGEFEAEGWLQPTYYILLFYSLGLFSYSLVTVLARTSQAQHDFHTPVKAGAIGVTANILLCTLFVRHLPIWSLALAASIASSLNGLTLFITLWRRLHFSLPELLTFGGKVILATAGMGIACWLTIELLPDPQGVSLVHLLRPIIPVSDELNAKLSVAALYLLRVVLGMGVSLTVYALLGWGLFRHELLAVMKKK
jgi:peptidoglycan biosynthesis protein MviN/MurJ (putative lipid II flippase)